MASVSPMDPITPSGPCAERFRPLRGTRLDHCHRGRERIRKINAHPATSSALRTSARAHFDRRPGYRERFARLTAFSYAVAPQEPILFHRSIRENIAYGRPDASLDEVRRVARLACAEAFIDRLPGGYDCLVGERGATLSGVSGSA